MSRTKRPPSLFPNRRLKPPATLSEGAATVFRQIVESVAHDHFSAVDLVLVTEYSRACDLANRADAELTRDGAVVGGKANPWLAVQEKAQRAIVALCARLRVSPQSRFDRLKAGTTSRPQYRPWDPDGLLAQDDEVENKFARNGPKPKTGLASFRK
jgi:phage terminase small subunit